MRHEVTIYADPLKATLFLFGCIVFLILGIALSQWLAVALCSVGIPASIAMMSEERYYLKLTPLGLEIRTYFGKKFVYWRHVENFHVGFLRGNKGVRFSYKENHVDGKISRTISSLLWGTEGFIPNSYDKPAEEILRMLCEWHERYTTTTPNNTLQSDAPTSGAPLS